MALSGAGPQLFVVYANLALYAFCYQMQQPVLPARVESLVVGDSSDDWASLQSWFGIMQLAGGLLSGVLSDKFGAKSLLLLSFASSAVCYFMQVPLDFCSPGWYSFIPHCHLLSLMSK
jgi:MFS family permease